MALVVEDGSQTPGANSFVTVAEARAYAQARASSFPAEDSAVEASLIVAKDYLETFRADFKGSKVTGTQALQWPRTGADLDGFAIASNEIPQVLKDAQCQLALENSAGLDLMPTGTGREVIREKVDVIETQYSPGAGGAPQPILAKARALVDPLCKGGSGFGLEVNRV